ncbi:MAG: 16S rRNA (uracil(1498)-N(3))-methyltransferase [Aquificaceae bacterium]|nr:16S rRNA (uracil(1498)-N(3))-methyltransferase [Aquificaceae bacterium]MDW8096884.1 RsmE family RNA methyltransferase [Aquificaceae bacterium]
MHRFLATRKGNLLVISGQEFRHFRALRVKKGALVELLCEEDLFLASVLGVSKDCALCAPIQKVKKTTPTPQVVVYQCLPVELRLMEEVVDRLSQAGAVKLVPLLCERGSTAKRPEEKLDKWRRLALSAFKQCGRPEPLEVASPVPLKEFVLQEELVFLLDNFNASRSIKEVDLTKHTYGLVVGPEGGFSRREVTLLVEKGCVPLLLKPYVYRTEMAGAVATALLMNLAGQR